jgi:hypothetical protein
MKKDRTNPIAVIQPAEYGLIHTLYYYIKGMQYCSCTYAIAGCTRDVRKSWGRILGKYEDYKEPTDMPDRKDFTDSWVASSYLRDPG